VGFFLEIFWILLVFCALLTKSYIPTLITEDSAINQFADRSSIIPFPSKASKKKKFFRGSPFPEIALITSCDVTSQPSQLNITNIFKTQWKQVNTCPRIPPITAQTGGNSVVFITNLSNRVSGTCDSLRDCQHKHKDEIDKVTFVKHKQK